jgi:molybdenum cofactor cytidylyltransferase
MGVGVNKMSKDALILNKCGIILLAAGASRRLGRPKQLLVYKGQSLISNVLELMEAAAMPGVVVLGANIEVIKKELSGTTIPIVENKQWNEGMGSSIVCGLEALMKIITDLDGVIFLVCDQPFLTVSFLQELLIMQHKTGKPIIASSYGNTVGIPALFHETYFPELLSLKGDAGAKKIMQAHTTDMVTIDFSLGHIDIDTEEAYKMLNND